MSRITIDTGTAGNAATGDSLRTAFTKVNTNFAELYAELGGDSLDAISFTNNTISTDITNANLILTGNGTGGVIIEDIEITGSTVNVLTTNNNLTLNTNGTGKVVINGLSFPTTDGTAGQVLKTDGAGNLSFTAVDPGAITIVGDDSSGTAVNIGETFKIAGSGTVTTSVSGDTITITGSASAQGITFVGDDSTGTRVSDGESFKVTGTQNITTAVSGDTLTITGINTGDFAFSGNTLGTTSSNADMELDPAGTGNLILKSGNFLPTADNTQYLGSASKRWHTLYVGPGSININGVTISESAGKLNIPGGVTGTQGLASIILPVPSSLPYSGQNDNLGNPFVFANNTVFLDQHTYLYIQGKVAAGGIWAGWTVGTGYPESLGFTPATFTHTHSNGALTQLTLASGGSGLSVAATDNIMAFRNGDPITTTLASPYAGILGTVDAQGSSQDTLTTINQLTAGGTFTAQDQSLFFDNINLQSNANIVFPDSTTQSTAAKITVVGDDSTGTTLNAGETIKIAGTQNITTAVSGDTLTITGPNLSSYATTTYVDNKVSANNTLTIADDTSTTSSINLDNTLQVIGGNNITTTILGNVLTVTGSTNVNIDTITPSDSSGVGLIGTLNTRELKVQDETFEGYENIYKIDNKGLLFHNKLNQNYAFPRADGNAQTKGIMMDHYTDGYYVKTVGDTVGSSHISKLTFDYIDLASDLNVTERVGTLRFNSGAGGSGQESVKMEYFPTASGESNSLYYSFAKDGLYMGSSLANIYAFGSQSYIGFNYIRVDGVDIKDNTITTNSSNANLELSANGSGTIELLTNTNVSGTLSADTLDVNSISSSDSSAIQINDAVNVSGAGTFHGSVRFNAGYTEKINALTSSSTITVNCAAASIHTVTLAVSTGFVISNLPTGGTVTLIITQGGSGSYTATFGTDGSTTVKFPGGAPTLSTAVGAIDVVTVFNDGTNYLGNIAKAYAA
jgi:hypothetical protein